MVPATAAALPPRTDAVPVQHLCDLSVDLQPVQMIGTATGTRLTFVIAGGKVTGPAVRGELLPGGGDWLRVGSDGVGRVDVRATIRSHDGALIHLESRGVIKVPADGFGRLLEGRALPYAETYVRTTPVFDTDDDRYAWLSQVVAVGYNVLSPNRVDYRIYRLL
ncbi:hypothetical protein CRI77_17760 [Mycolicibacterium duvalii]|uniref:UPF0311 protein MDUV_17080 n=1 Tax=Mycolicibacterium duvalii TaxID=39688 RepID=A0A7I7JZU0_9MYCO|nr:DUF3237 domain-containing protein [Mycolicibacterium duvalii]MCV7368774.1 DUF3237 domain-containing protein [Mycolicibacterium duvalii]PEG38632.1 hypothetical protein CRI77_17760 [Mycolicibacterium duvalii]BBX16848.1 UPF0311 protein [Mycolicibacterium duvalii]